MGTFQTATITLAALLVANSVAFAQSPGQWSNQPIGRLGEAASYTSPDETLRLDASIGAAYIEGSEKVFIGNYTLSHLIWQSTAPILRGSVALEVGNGFSVKAEGATAGFGRSYMEDYDWTRGDDTFNNWSHRSQHPDTNLDHYYTGGASLGYELVRDNRAVVRAHGGFKYTDVKWSAYGGSYVYSNPGFRDDVGSFADGTPAIAYRQQFPELFLGIDGEERYGNFRVGGLLRGGMTFLSTATDEHWMRDLRFVDTLYVAPTFTAGVDLGFALGRNAELTLAARYDQVFEARGDTTYSYISSGASRGSAAGAAGGGMRSAEITAGLRGTF
ncbi:plasminogen activator [Devosia sp. YR412]|uniref:omptin family outer membrane protease n=1 Tax=Devosia sp. YR412 TaxID=1881030 RepID=UPI0008CAAC97|nr:omptin family outer membrane protease [Devosia sp. YR412]SEQ25928.1 plasminogen activator [Devosia sp. YR412]